MTPFIKETVERLRAPAVEYWQTSNEWEPYAAVRRERPVDAIKLEAAARRALSGEPTP